MLLYSLIHPTLLLSTSTHTPPMPPSSTYPYYHRLQNWPLLWHYYCHCRPCSDTNNTILPALPLYMSMDFTLHHFNHQLFFSDTYFPPYLKYHCLSQFLPHRNYHHHLTCSVYVSIVPVCMMMLPSTLTYPLFKIHTIEYNTVNTSYN